MPARISVALAVMCVLQGAASAQSAESEALFRDGKRLIKEGKLAEGCGKIEASERVESSTGTLLNLGDCKEKLGQLASSWAAFAKAATSAKRDNDQKRQAEAKRRAKLLEPRLGKLTIKIQSPPDGLEIKRDDEVIDSALWNSDAPVDAGTYEIHAAAPGYKAWSTRVTTKDGERVTVEVPELAHDSARPAKPDTSKPGPAQHDDSEQRDEEVTPPGTFTTLRGVSIGVGVVGLAGIAVGIKMGLDSRDLERRSDAICPMTACADAGAVQLNKDARDKAKYANVGYVAGGVLVAGAVVLWFVGAPTTSRETLSLVPAAHGTGLAIAGSF